MDELSIDYVLSFKSHPDCKSLDQDTINIISKLNISIDKKHTNVKKNISIKNPKIQNKKDTLENKVNLILNKLSENNMLNLINDFITSIGKINNTDWEIVQKTIYLKIMSEINFVKIYLQFLILINQIYNKVLDYNISTFITNLENTFMLTYITNANNNNNDIEEQKRVNNLIIIRNLVDLNVLSNDILDNCINTIFNQNKYITDIYFWFSYNKNNLNNYTNEINKVLKTELSTRERVLLESLSLCTDVKKQSTPTIITKPINTLNLEINNIIEPFEYILKQTH